MSADREDLVHYLEQIMLPGNFSDYCPNGLQVEGSARIARLATGVTASQRLLDAAIAWGADAILVHHGYFWNGESPRVVGMKRRRLAALLVNEVNLLAYHLPLDAHPEYGNNARLGQLMGLSGHRALNPDDPAAVGNVADLEQPVPASEMVARLETITGRSALHIGESTAPVRRIAWCTGAAQGYIETAVAAGADLFVTGEASEQTVHVAREEGIHFVAAGHHATERFGVQALGEHLGDHFDLEHRFFEIANPV